MPLTIDTDIGLGVVYRYKATRYSLGIDEWGDALPGCTLKVHLYTYPIVKKTPKGVWINVWGDKRFIKPDAHNSWARLTEAEAKESFKARKKAQIRLLNEQLRQAQTELELIDQERMERTMYPGDNSCLPLSE